MGRGNIAPVAQAKSGLEKFAEGFDAAFDKVDSFFGMDSRPASSRQKVAPAAPAAPAPAPVMSSSTTLATRTPAARIVEAIDESGVAIFVVSRGADCAVCNSRELAVRVKVWLDHGG